jgi:hypothetical protein
VPILLDFVYARQGARVRKNAANRNSARHVTLAFGKADFDGGVLEDQQAGLFGVALRA